MDKEKRSRLQKATQEARRLLEEEFRSQLLQTYDIDVDRVRWAEEPGAHLQAEQRLIREKLLAWIEHKEGQIHDRKEALFLAMREMSFTVLNRFVAFKLMEARELVRPCVSGGLESAGFQEFTAVAEGLLADQEGSYRLYLETIFEDVSRDVRVLFDPRDVAAALWPRRTALLELLSILNRPELAELWGVDESIGWVYQYFNSKEERQEMRKSAAPRNSRELAVRNQFFTPRYVVEFLTDNTLGRIWCEMNKGETHLAEQCRYLVRRPIEIFLAKGETLRETPEQEDLRQEELLQQPVHIPHRPIKDPREIRLLDPACGSMHFGLYAFDLFETIYEEAWDNSSCPALKEVYASKDEFLKDVPRLIVEHNIHGIDIDPRAVQIAGLALWLRAQKAWQARGISPADRPRISRSNIVCAEPMPGSPEMLDEFVATLDSPLLGVLVKTVFEKMQLAGEAGSLLKIEEDIRNAIDAARAEWLKNQYNLFTREDGSQDEFFETAEHQIIDALRAYAEIADAASCERRLFADDAASGFAFIDLCRRRYDVVVMNPPFGDAPSATHPYFKSLYMTAKHDLATAVLERAREQLLAKGLVGAITTRTIYFLSYVGKWREKLLIEALDLQLFVDLGSEVLDAMVETAMVTACEAKYRNGKKTAFLRVSNKDDHQTALIKGVEHLATGMPTEDMFHADVNTFKAIPKAPFAYWVPDGIRELFRKLSSFENNERHGHIGALSQDDFRFVRTWWETPPSRVGKSWTTGSDKRWVPYVKGGTYSPFYMDLPCQLGWADDGSELKAFLVSYRQGLGVADNWTGQLNSYERYFTEGLTWSSRPIDQGSFWILPEGCIFRHSAPAVFDSSKRSLLYDLAVLNSTPYRFLLDLLMPRGSSGKASLKYELGYVRAVPIPEAPKQVAEKLSSLARSCARLIQSASSSIEENHLFCRPTATFAADSIHTCFSYYSLALTKSGDELIGYTKSIDYALLPLYELDNIDGRRLLGSSNVKGVYDRIENLEPFRELNIEIQTARSASYFIGSAFGRWDIRYASGERKPPELPDPFDPLPVCPPGMLQNADGLPAEPKDVPADYPLRISWPGILVDDENHTEDIVARVRDAIAVIWKDRADAIEQEACGILGVQTLRDYFRRPSDFFADHLKRYSKSRRQAPIYWQLSSGNGSYSVWLYYHRFTTETLYQALNFVELRIEEAEREQFSLESQGVLSGDGATRLQETQALLQDLRLLKKELDPVAPLWNPNLNDGVIINHALLWRITPYSPWQKKCKDCWDKLVNGDYDWAHLAFHLWPERVIRKCTTDRSLSIAHGLEERLWQENKNGNWLPRQISEADLQALIAKHTKSSVQSALEHFLAAPPPVAAARTRAPRAASSSSTGTTRRSRSTATVVDAEASRQILFILNAAPAEGLSRNDIADLLGVEASSLTAVIKQLKEIGQIEQLGAARGAKYRLTEKGHSVVESQGGEDQEA